MKKIYPSTGIYIFLFLILIFEGLGWSWGRVVSRYLFLIVPAILFGIDLWQKKVVRIPVILSFVFILFSFSTALSTISAVYIEAAFEHQLYYLAIFLLFIYAYNHKNELQPLFKYFVVSSTIVILVYSTFVTFLLPDTWEFLLPRGEYQFIFERWEDFSHHPIGAFILIPLIFFFSIFWNKPKPFTGSMVLLLFSILLLSFLRSAYVAFIVVVLFYLFATYRLKKYSNVHKIISLLIIVISIFTFLVVTNISSNIPILGTVNKAIISRIGTIQNKSLLNARDHFVEQAIDAILERPLTGIGSYNFYYASMRYANSDAIVTGTSHNLFLDIFVENGIIGGVIFILLVGFISYKGFRVFKEGNIVEKYLYAIYIALLILFQFGHYHKMYFLFIFFFFIAALLYEEKNNTTDKLNISFSVSVFLLVCSVIFTTSRILYNYNFPHAAVKIYPLSIQAQRAAVTDYLNKAEYEKAELQITKLYALYSQEPFTLEFIGDYYKNISNHQEAIKYYLMALEYAPNDLAYLKFLYEEYEVMSGQEKARTFIQEYIDKSEILQRNPPGENTYLFYEWCRNKAIQCLIR